MGAIRNWSSGPSEDLQGEAYSERLTLEDGRVISVHLAPVSDRQEFLGTVSIFRDITHQVEVDRLKSEFVATVSHELRTPMTPIKGYVEFLLMGGAGELNEQQGQFLDIIKDNVDRLSVLVNDLLDVSRIEAGKVALSFQPIDMNEITQEVIENLIRVSEEEQRPVRFNVRTPQDLPSVYGDIERVRQIMTNLMDNAYKYSPENSTVTVTMSQKDGALQIDIKDQGIGIFPDEHERIFERFYRGENHLVMATPGTGLGLPIVKELVEMHNGRIWVTSSGVPGEGSTFSFSLPIYHAQHNFESEPEEV
jgi:signal transduction histidine kinase